MADRVVLHVGLMKSGTSYVQARCAAAPEALAAAGVLFPGTQWRDQVVAISDALGRGQRAAGDFDGAWDRMRAEIDAYDGTALISMEFLGPASADKLRPILDSLAPTPVEAVVTVRDLGRALPSMWQETLKNGLTWWWHDYLTATRAHDQRSNFWREQDAGAITQTWVDLLGANAVSVVTLPTSSSDPEELWQRFCEAARLPVDCAPPLANANESLGAASADLLRRVNLVLAGRDVPWPAYSRVVKFGLAKSLLADHRSAEESIGFEVPRWVRQESSRVRRELEASGARIVGSWEDLVPRSSRGLDPDKLAANPLSDAAVHAIVGLLDRDLERYAREGEQ